MKIYILSLLIVINILVFAQSPIDVTEQSVNLGKRETKTFYYAFNSGDKIVFSCNVIKGKKIAFIEVGEYGKIAVFSASGVKAEDRSFITSRKVIYGFSFHNEKRAKKVVSFKVQRIPESKDKEVFNSLVRYDTRIDTVYQQKYNDITVGYDTVKRTVTDYKLISADTQYVSIVNERVSIRAGKTETRVINLPVNYTLPNNYKPTEAKEVIGWGYLINTIQPKESDNAAWRKALSGLGGVLGAPIGAGRYVANLLTGTVDAVQSSQGERNVRFNFHGTINGINVSLASGNVVRAGKQINGALQGYFGLNLYNDNFMNTIAVEVEVGALVVKKTWGNVSRTVPYIRPVTERRYYTVPQIVERKIPRFDE